VANMLSWLDGMEFIAEQPVQPVYLVVGTEFSLIKRIVEQLRIALSDKEQQTVVRRSWYDEEGAHTALFQCDSLSLFGGETLIVLENCSAFTTTPKGKWDIGGIEKYLETPVAEKTLVITVHADKLDERKKITKLAKRFSWVDCTTPKEDVCVMILADWARMKGLKISRPLLLDVMRRSQQITSADKELDKLYTFCAEREVTQEDVELLVSRRVEDDVFLWIDAVVKGNLRTAFAILNDVNRAGYDGFALLALMARQIRLMWFAKTLGRQGLTPAQIAAQVSAHPYAVKKAAEQATGVSLEVLESWLLRIADAEFFIKSGKQEITHAITSIVVAFAVTIHSPRRVR